MEKFGSRIWDKHPGSATLQKLTIKCLGETIRNHLKNAKEECQILKPKLYETGKPWSRTW
jgi:hypothetical protein